MSEDIVENFDPSEEEIELASVETVGTYQRRTESGQMVTVKAYVRTDPNAVAERAKSIPGRPSMAGTSGRFPGNRSLPMWPDAGKGREIINPKEDAPQYEGMSDTGEVDQATLDKEVPIALEILPNFPQNPAMKQLISILRGLSSASLSEEEGSGDDIIELARGTVRISGYSYISKKTGKLVRVNPYTQLRSLINAMGGPQMAARKGVTPDLLDKALPGFQIKDKLFKAKPNKPRLGAASKVRTKKDRENLAKINRLPIDRVIDIPAPKPGDDTLRKALSPTHPLEAARSSLEGSKVTRGNESWTRGLDGLWYKTPRRNNRGIDDKELTRRLVSKAGTVEVTHADPIPRKTFPLSNVNYDMINPNSANYAEAVRYTKSLEPVFANLPEGVADTLMSNIEVRKLRSDSKMSSLTHTTTTKANNYLPKLVVHSNPELEADLMKYLPKQQQLGFNVPSVLHPLETSMARESASYAEKLLLNRAPSDMVDRMYDRMSAAYDRHISKDDGSYGGLSGRDGWNARLTGVRSEELTSEIREQLSFSGSRSRDDFLAEAWTEFVGHPAPRPLARDVGKAFQDSLEEFSDYLFKNNWADASEIPERTYLKNQKRSISRSVSDAIGGDSDNLVEVDLTPRALRDVLRSSSKYFDVRDENGSATFDAHIQVDGSSAYIGTLSLPRTDPDSLEDYMPNIPVEEAETVRRATYYSTPEQDLMQGPKLRDQYARYIDEGRAVKAIEAVEESLISEGVTDFWADPRAGDNSIVYARAGYKFDPVATDVAEISSMLEDMSNMVDTVEADMAKDFFPISPSEKRAVKKRISEMKNNLYADPVTWPTPAQIADIGKTQQTERSLGEDVLDRYSWSGYKNVPRAKTQEKAPPQPGSPPEVPASSIGSAARAMHPSRSTKNIDDLSPLMQSIVDRFVDEHPGAKAEVTGSVSAHTLRVSTPDGEDIARVDVMRDGDVVTWSNSYIAPTQSAARMFFEMQDNWDAAYQQAGLKEIRQKVNPDDPISGYALAQQGYDWSNPGDKAKFVESMSEAVDNQVEAMRTQIQEAITAKHITSPTETLMKAQQDAESVIAGLSDSLRKQVNSLAEKYTSDPKGPTPLEVAQIGKKEAYMVSDLSRTSPTLPTSLRTTPSTRGSEPVLQLLPSQRPPAPTILGGIPPTPPVDSREVERQLRMQGSLIQQMTNLDGDPLHDNFIEFAGKQFLTFGAYEMYKTLGGYWKWATDAYSPTARKASVSLLFMLLRLLPASAWRGAMLQTAQTLTKKLKSPRPEDWPTPSEIAEVIQSVKNHVPEPKAGA